MTQVLWLYKQRIQQKLQEILECSSIVVEWRNIKTIISQAAVEILGKYEVFIQKENLKIWDHKIKLIIQQKNVAYNKYLRTKSETDYKRRRAIAKREIRHHISLE
jgi:hypothetical protein